MSPIVDLQRRLRELGRIRAGTKGDKGQPVKLTTWRLTSPSEPLLEVAADLYGGDVQPWQSPAGEQFELTTNTDTLDAIIPPGNTFSQWYEMWSGGGCQRRCDGNIEQITDGPCLCPEDDEERRALASKGKACGIHTRLGVILPRIPDVGLWRLDTGGFFAATELAGAYDLTQMATTQGRMVPVSLRLDQRMSKRAGQTLRFAVPVLELGATIGELMSGDLLALGDGREGTATAEGPTGSAVSSPNVGAGGGSSAPTTSGDEPDVEAPSGDGTGAEGGQARLVDTPPSAASTERGSIKPLQILALKKAHGMKLAKVLEAARAAYPDVEIDSIQNLSESQAESMILAAVS